MASDDMLLLPARLASGGGYPPAPPANPGARPMPGVLISCWPKDAECRLIWPWVLRLGGSTDLGTRGRAAPGHVYACSPAPQARGLSLLRCESPRAGSVLGMRVGFAGLGRMGRPGCAIWSGPVTWSRPRTCELSLTAWLPGGVGWGGTPAESAAEAEVLIIILPGARNCTLSCSTPAAREDQPLRRSD